MLDGRWQLQLQLERYLHDLPGFPLKKLEVALVAMEAVVRLEVKATVVSEALVLELETLTQNIFR